jgi:hypothetical protein
MDVRIARMQDRIPAQLLMQKLVDEHDAREPVSRLKLAFGVSPIPTADLSWYTGVRGEQIVGEALRTLPSAWRVFHSIPVGRRDSDVDHIVVGPGGLFVLNTKHHSGKTVFVNDRALWVSGRKTHYISNSESEAASVTRIVRGRLPWAPDVRPVIVVVDTKAVNQKRAPLVVEVQGGRTVARWLRKQKTELTADAVDQLIAVLDDPRTWRATEPADSQGIALRFAELASGHRRAALVRLAWVLAGVAIVVVVTGAVALNLR